MKSKKVASILAAGILGISTLLSSAPAYSKNEVKETSSIEQRVENEVSIKKEVPHYLRNLTPITELNNLDDIQKEIRKTADVFRMYETTSLSGNYEGVKISNFSEEETVSVYGKEIRLVFHEYIKEGDKVIYHSPLGREEISLAEFELVKKDLIEQLKIAVDKNVEAYSKLPGKVKQELEKMLEIDDLDAIADQEIPNYGITYGDVLGYFKLEHKDFVPNELHLAKIPALGVSYVNAKTVLYSPVGRAEDYLLGWPSVLAHELTHSCRKLQSVPFSWQFDSEFEASFVQLGKDMSFITYMLHGYLEPLREVEERYFSFSTEKMLKQILGPAKITNYELNEETLKKEFPMMDIVREEFKETLPAFFAEYYANRLFWITVNERFKDNNAWLDILMAQKYEPTIYLEPGKENQGALDDLTFLKEITDSGILEEIRVEAWDRLEKEKNNPNLGPIMLYKRLRELSHLYHVDPVTIQRFLEKEGIKDIYNIPPEKLEKLEQKVNDILEDFAK